MRNLTHYVGVDGCRAGWFAVEIDDSGAWRYAVYADIRALWTQHHTAEHILIDMPIGLSDTGRRQCEREARKSLGARRSSIFSVPVRAALDVKTYAEASAINFERSGLKLSKQTWNIMPKIREVDHLLRENDLAREKFMEVHPEVLFRGLTGAPMTMPKKTAEGFAERLDVLEQYLPDAETVIDAALRDFPRKQVVRDDIVDALVIAIVARIGNFESLPAIPDVDAEGLPMRIVYSKG